MAASDRDTTTAVEDSLLSEGGTYSFAQVMRLLRRRIETDGRGSGPRRIRVRPSLDLDLPRSPVASVRKDEAAGAYEVRTTFLGLYGSSAPLPAFYTEDLIDSAQEDHTGAQAFLDLLHQHLYGLFLEAERKYRPLFGAVEEGRTQFTDLLNCFVGLREPEMRLAVQQPERLSRYIGLLGRRQRSAEGLKTLLMDAFQGVSVEIEQCVSRFVRIPSAARLLLGEQASSLGSDALLGEAVEDRMGKIRVRLGPLDAEQFKSLLNEPDQWELLVGLIHFYLPAPLVCELRFVLKGGEVSPAQFGGGSWGNLGHDTWLVGEAANSELTATMHLA